MDAIANEILKAIKMTLHQKIHYCYNLCVDAQIRLRTPITEKNQKGLGKVNYLKAIEYCEGR